MCSYVQVKRFHHIIVIVRNGEVVFNVEGEDVTLTNEDVLLFDPLEMHSLKALKALKAVTNVDLVIVKIK